MKHILKLSSFVLFLFVLSFVVLVSSCTEKGTIIPDSIESNETKQLKKKQTTFERNGILYPLSKGKEVTMSCGADTNCSGANTGSQDNCRVQGNPNTGVFECSCEGCKMTVSSKLLRTDIDYVQILEVETIGHHKIISDHSKKKYGEEILGFNNIELSFTKDLTVVVYEFELTNGQLETIMLITEYDLMGRKASTVTVDCTKSCDDGNTEGCRERFIYPNTYECTCSGCEMDIS